MATFKVTTSHEVEPSLTAHIAEAFAEWLETQGFAIERSRVAATDQRSYQDLASDFAADMELKST